MLDFKLSFIFGCFLIIIIFIIYIFYVQKQEKAKNAGDKTNDNHYESKILIISFFGAMITILLALPGFINDINLWNDNDNTIDTNTTIEVKPYSNNTPNEKNDNPPVMEYDNKSSLYTFNGGIIDRENSICEECHLKSGKYTLKVSELDKKIKLEIRTKDNILFLENVSNMEEEINIEIEDTYYVCLYYLEGPTKYIVELKSTNNESDSYNFFSGIVHIGDSNCYKCKLDSGMYCLDISELDYDIKIEIRNKDNDNIVFSDIVSNIEKEINIDVEDDYNVFISYYNGFTKYRVKFEKI